MKHQYTMRLVKDGQVVNMPEGFRCEHTVLIEPKRGKPYFAVLCSDQEKPKSQLPGAIGFNNY